MPCRTLLTILILLACFLPGNAFANIVLFFNNSYSAQNRFTTEVVEHWAQQVHEVTKGRVTIRVENQSKLGETSQAYQVLKRGTANIGFLCPMYYPQKFRLGEVFDLPMVGSLSSEKNSVTAWDIFTATPAMQEEFSEFEVLWIFVSAPYGFHMMDENITDLESLKGKKITAAGALAHRAAQLLGAKPRNITMSGTAAAFQNGNAEGCLLPYSPLRREGIAKYLNFHLDENILSNSIFISMDKEIWKALSGQDREAIRSVSGRAMSALSGRIADETTETGRRWMVDKGDTFSRLSREEREIWLKRLRPMWNEWVEHAQHPDARKLLENVLRAMKD